MTDTEAALCCCISAAGILARFHTHDAVCPRVVLHCGGIRTDDVLGQRQASQLPEGVQRVSHTALPYPTFHPVAGKYNTKNNQQDFLKIK